MTHLSLMEILLWYALLAAWIVGAIATMVHLVKRVHASAWVLVPVAVALLVLPVITVAVYWLVVAVRRVSRPKQASGPGHAPTADAPA